MPSSETIQSTTTTLPARWTTARVYRLPVAADFIVSVPADDGGHVLVVGGKTRPRSPRAQAFFIDLLIRFDVRTPPATKWAKLTRDAALPAEDRDAILRAFDLLVAHISADKTEAAS